MRKDSHYGGLRFSGMSGVIDDYKKVTLNQTSNTNFDELTPGNKHEITCSLESPMKQNKLQDELLKLMYNKPMFG